jgi:hypothetical protein
MNRRIMGQQDGIDDDKKLPNAISQTNQVEVTCGIQ